MARQGGQRPEASGSAPQLYAADGERYTGQNAGIQSDMATLALQLLGLQVRRGRGRQAMWWLSELAAAP